MVSTYTRGAISRTPADASTNGPDFPASLALLSGAPGDPTEVGFRRSHEREAQV